MTNEQQFSKLKDAWRKADEACGQFRLDLAVRYGGHSLAPIGKRDKLDGLRAREGKAQDAVFAWLDQHSPRSWRTGVPAWWVCCELTYADAITNGRLSVVPPVCYGGSEYASQQFALAVA